MSPSKSSTRSSNAHGRTGMFESLVMVLTARTFWIGIGSIFGILLAIFVVMNYWILPSYTQHGAGTPVPDVSNLPFAEAQVMLENLGFRIEKRDQYHNSEFELGVVLEQRPPPETVVKPGRVVTLFVNGAESRSVEVPDLVNLREDEASDQIREAGLDVGDITVDSTSTLPANTVVRQRPAAGQPLDIGGRVDLVVSVGEINRMITVPDLFNMTVQQATETLESLDLQIEIAFGGEVGDPETLVVLRQSPVPGAGAPQKSIIKVSVGKSNAPVQPQNQDGTSSDDDGRFDF